MVSLQQKTDNRAPALRQAPPSTAVGSPSKKRKKGEARTRSASPRTHKKTKWNPKSLPRKAGRREVKPSDAYTQQEQSPLDQIGVVGEASNSSSSSKDAASKLAVEVAQAYNDAHSSLLRLPDELIEAILSPLDHYDQKNVSNVCQKLCNISIKLIYRHVRLELCDRKLNAQDIVTIRDRMKTLGTRDLELIIKNQPRGQEFFQTLVSIFEFLPLDSLLFEDAPIEQLIDPTEELEMPMSPLSSTSWKALNQALQHFKDSNGKRSYIRSIKFPQHDLHTVQNVQNPTLDMDLLDSNIVIEFEPVQHSDEIIKVEARGNLQCGKLSANGTPVSTIRHLLEYKGVGRDFKVFALSGIHPDRLQLPYLYEDPIERLHLASPASLANITKFTLHNFHCASLPPSLYESVDLSRIKTFELIQCKMLPLVFGYFMTPKDQITIENLRIELYDLMEPLRDDEDNGFEKFCKSFTTLTTVNIKACSPWNVDMSIFKGHQDLRICNLDFGMDMDMDNLEWVGENKLLRELSYSDNFMIDPLRKGTWDKAFHEHFHAAACTLEELEHLETLRIFMKPIENLAKWDSMGLFADTTDDPYEILAICMHAYLGKFGIRLNRIIFADRDIRVDHQRIIKRRLPEGRVFPRPSDEFIESLILRLP